MRKVILLSSLLTLIFTPFCFADNTKTQIINQLKQFQSQGIHQNTSYNLSELDQLKQCTSESMPYRQAADELRSSILKNNDVAFRLPAYQAADLAFQCLYCANNSIASCEKMSKYITKAETQLKKG
ncbi:hypothetical protein [Vibrio sp. ER1A]|uniref:hypothetical protein n=1 Tax=Vibrio sp. ER1A TaxID=1517681 RepID=UPI0004DD0871|nr:hypothetical protein [Vibrio sp. ER1A]KFA98788.1 hypothetical protein HW45_07140 [Vibrio sp. ER1A]